MKKVFWGPWSEFSFEGIHYLSCKADKLENQLIITINDKINNSNNNNCNNDDSNNYYNNNSSSNNNNNKIIIMIIHFNNNNKNLHS